jgi:hypothetical protein
MKCFKIFVLYLIIMIGITNSLKCQVESLDYKQQKIFPDRDYVYICSEKHTIPGNKNLAEDGYEYNFDFSLMKVDISGKKIWETVLEKKRNCGGTYEIMKKNEAFYTYFAINNFKRGHSIYTTHFLLKYDSLGNILEEKQIDSTFYPDNSIFYTKEGIYVILLKDQLICKKYDYNFNLIEIIENAFFSEFFYKSKTWYSGKNYISIGPLANSDALKKHLQNKSLWQYKPSGAYVKVSSGILSKNSKVLLYPLPTDEIISFAFFDSLRSYIVMEKHGEKTIKHKLYTFTESSSKLQLITDTLTLGLNYVKELGPSEILFVRQGLTKYDDKTHSLVDYPPILYHVKKDRILLRQELNQYDGKSGNMFFSMINKKLTIYKIYFAGNTLKVNTYDCEAGVFR